MKLRNNIDNKMTEAVDVKTLNDAIVHNEDEGKAITYLKVGIEGAELKAISEWIDSGALANVRQIGIEIHTGKVHLTKKELPDAIRSLLKDLARLYDLGFRIISYSPNFCVGKRQDEAERLYRLADLVLYKI